MTADPRKADEYRIPAAQLKKGDLVNVSPGDDDWQEVLAVHLNAGSATDDATRTLLKSLGGRYVLVELTDLASVDNTIYFTDDGTALTNGEDEDADVPVSELVSEENGLRIYLFTKYELVTVRATG